ncbi:hypothetical protein VPH35_060156 [Triticum aestivum]
MSLCSPLICSRSFCFKTTLVVGRYPSPSLVDGGGCPDRQIRCFPGRQRPRSPPPWWPQAPRPVSCTFLDPEANLVEVESMVMLPRFLLPGAPRSNNSSLEARRWFLISSPPSPCRLGSKHMKTHEQDAL